MQETKGSSLYSSEQEEWEEEKKYKSGSNTEGLSSGNQYEQSKFGGKKPDNKQHGNISVEKFNNVWHMLCNKGCG